MTEENNQAPAGEGPEFAIIRIYVKDISFETPSLPSFNVNTKRDLDLQLSTMVNELENDTYEVVLRLTVTAKYLDQTAFLIEVNQAGTFLLKGFDDEHKGHMLGAYCPNQLFPYAREVISDLVSKGGFPPLRLAPINFDVIYAEGQAQAAARAGSAAE